MISPKIVFASLLGLLVSVEQVWAQAPNAEIVLTTANGQQVNNVDGTDYIAGDQLDVNYAIHFTAPGNFNYSWKIEMLDSNGTVLDSAVGVVGPSDDIFTTASCDCTAPGPPNSKVTVKITTYVQQNGQWNEIISDGCTFYWCP